MNDRSETLEKKAVVQGGQTSWGTRSQLAQDEVLALLAEAYLYTPTYLYKF
jgi:hypothetical protein